MRCAYLNHLKILTFQIGGRGSFSKFEAVESRTLDCPGAAGLWSVQHCPITMQTYGPQVCPATVLILQITGQ